MKALEGSSDDTVDFKDIHDKHPNTYTLTKHFAEHIVNDFYGKLPICIVRPSVVTSAIEEPFPGWIDNYACFTGDQNHGTLNLINI